MSTYSENCLDFASVFKVPSLTFVCSINRLSAFLSRCNKCGYGAGVRIWGSWAWAWLGWLGIVPSGNAKITNVRKLTENKLTGKCGQKGFSFTLFFFIPLPALGCQLSSQCACVCVVAVCVCVCAGFPNVLATCNFYY